tara:strand:+ start:1696 stop:2073 length:378 start_codon:yes stop_codon:yes gene_type:complete
MSILKAFNNHLTEFIDDLIVVFPDNLDIKTGKTFVEGLKKINPKRLPMIWKECVVDSFKEKILEGDLDFFINKKDYDLGSCSNDKGREILEDLRSLVIISSEENKKKSMKYIQNLTKLCILYFSN